MHSTLQPGETLVDKYRIERELGSGGMASVFEVTHLHLGESAAIKVLHDDVAHLPGVVERFSREARAMSRLKSEHVARVQDVGELQSGQPYMVMEFLHGVDLSAAIAERTAFDPSDAVDLILQVCEAIAEAHARGIVHRDLKPSNLFLTSRPDGAPIIKVLDFGISKLTSTEGGLALTHTQALLGSPLYMAPEQIASPRDADGRTDIWGIGNVLYEMLTGRPPFFADSLRHLQYRILAEAPAPIRGTHPGVQEGLEAAVMKCLEKEPDARFANVGWLARALEPFASTLGSAYAERVCGIVSRAHTLAESAGQRSARLQASSDPHALRQNSEPAQATPAGASSPALVSSASNEGTGGVSASRQPSVRGTRGAWAGTPRRPARPILGLVAGAVVGVAALTMLVFAGIRYASKDGVASESLLEAPVEQLPYAEAARGPDAPGAQPLPAPPSTATPSRSSPAVVPTAKAPATATTAPAVPRASKVRPPAKRAAPPPAVGPGKREGGGLFDIRK